MSDAVIIALIASIPPTLAVVLGIQRVHKTVNSRMDELLRLARKEAHAEGVIEEKGRHEK